MKTYLAGTPVKLLLDQFNDADGNPYEVVSATYRVMDDRSTEIQASTPLDLTAEHLVIEADLNRMSLVLDIDSLTSETMEEVRLFEARVVEFELTLADGNIIPFDMAYLIAPREKLIPGLNSFQTLRESYINSMLIPNTTAWLASTEDDRVAAMIEARLRICLLQFHDVTLGQSYLSEQQMIGDLSRLPPKQFKKLTARFRKALCLAQLAEAEEILGGGDQSNVFRRSGLISQTIGETQEIYRTSKPVDMQVSKTALRYLSPYITLSKKIGRAG